jgi:rubrerythrin
MNTKKLNDIIDFAIAEEVKAYTMYEAAMQKTKDQAGQSMLKELANMERGHEAKLKALKEGKDVEFDDKRVEDLKISDYMDTVDLKDDSGFQEVLVFAMKAEKKAYELYLNMSQFYMRKEKGDLLVNLANEELKHKNMLERYYDDNIYVEN